MNNRRAVETGRKRTFQAEHCEESGKAIYRTKRKALRVNGALSTRGFRNAEAYVCRYCGWWHITTRRQDA